MKTKDILALKSLFKETSLDPNTIEDGVLASNLNYKICLVSEANKITIQGIKRRFGVLAEASMQDDGYIDTNAIKKLFADFEDSLDNAFWVAKEEEEEQERIQKILEDKPRKQSNRIAKKKEKKKKEKSKVEKPKKEKGVRYNKGKVRFDLIPPSFIREIAEVLTFLFSTFL